MTPNEKFKELFLDMQIDISDSKVDMICDCGLWRDSKNWYDLLVANNLEFTFPEMGVIAYNIEKTIEALKEGNNAFHKK